MSLDEFFSKKSKKKAKAIKASDLLEKIKNTNPVPQPEPEINNDILQSTAGDADEWEPIQNDIVPDFADLSIRDLDEEEEEQLQGMTRKGSINNGKEISKANKNEVAWKIKPKAEVVEKEEEPKVKESPAPYVPACFRNKDKMPNVDSIEEFPTLDAVKNPPAKKVEKAPEPVDNTWIEARGSGKRKEENTGLYVPPRGNGGSTGGFNSERTRYVPSVRDGGSCGYPSTGGFNSERTRYNPSVRDGGSGGFHSRGGYNSERSGFNSQSSAPATSGWTRGSTIKKEDVPVFNEPKPSEQVESGSERKFGLIPASRPYVPGRLKNAQPITQSNRFAQLDNS